MQGRSAPAFWERRGIISWLLWPISKLFGLFVSSKNALRDLGIGVGKPFAVPIIIVGNLRVGGTGKTPIVIALAERLRARGFYPGIISRGYGGRSHSKQSNPMQVNSNSDPAVVGDEPVLMAQRTQGAVPFGYAQSGVRVFSPFSMPILKSMSSSATMAYNTKTLRAGQHAKVAVILKSSCATSAVKATAFYCRPVLCVSLLIVIVTSP